MEIKSVKVLQKEVVIIADDGKGEVIYTRRSEPHKDFINSIEELDVHLANINEESDEAVLHVNGFSLYGTGEAMSVILKGQKILSTDKVFSMNSPKTTLKGGDYELENKLYKILMKVVDQAAQYLQGKINPTPIEEEIEKKSQ